MRSCVVLLLLVVVSGCRSVMDSAQPESVALPEITQPSNIEVFTMPNLIEGERMCGKTVISKSWFEDPELWIVVDRDLPERTQAWVFLHEYAHVLDYLSDWQLSQNHEYHNWISLQDSIDPCRFTPISGDQREVFADRFAEWYTRKCPKLNRLALSEVDFDCARGVLLYPF